MTLPADLVPQIFFLSRKSICFHTLVADMIKGSKWWTQVSSPAIKVLGKFGSFWSNSFHLQHWCILVCIYSLTRWWGTHLEQTRWSCKLLCRIWNIDVFRMLVDVAISSYVISWFSCRIVHTVLTFWSFTVFSGQPGLETSSAD